MGTEDRLRDYLKRASAELQRTKERLRAAERGEEIAVVGMACRLPGGIGDPAALWRALADGAEASGPFPADRGWDLDALHDPDPATPGTCYATAGGFLPAADFDAGFFGISPREAKTIDPQHRLLLELAWEAVEHAGADPAELSAGTTGVYAGVMYNDYGGRIVHSGHANEGHLLTGSAPGVASGRVAYHLGLRGPAVTVDTACSSSLVAVHLACQALRAGECTAALAGGATLMATPAPFVEFSRQRGLSPDGRCRSFSAAADGVGWAEGGGFVLLKRLSDARRDGDRVLAVIAGSAINSDGASGQLTAPNGPAQQRVIRAALAAADLAPADVDAVEAHGTGTTLGDPIEAQALIGAYGADRKPGHPLWIGSVKSNLGHTQAAAGVTGLIKMVMALREGTLPRTLDVGTPNPHVDWSAGEVALLTEARPWPAGERPRRAGVSSFGISGTNAHVIVAEAPDTEPGSAPEPAPLVLSAHTPEALSALAAAVAATEGDRDAIGRALAGRGALAHRAVVLADDATAALTRLAAGGAADGLVTGHARPGTTALLFTGQGSQRPGMGKELAAAFPVFATALAEVCAEVDPLLGRSLRELVFGDSPDLDRTEFTQPALFAVEVALARLLESWGVRPDYVIGHSVGEIAAAHVAGVFTLADAARLVVARGAMMQAARAGGAMVSLQATEAELAPMLRGKARQASVAALNGPTATVISGDTAVVSAIARMFEQKGRRTRLLKTSHAFHSPHMDGVLAGFREVVAQITAHAPTIPLVSNLTGLTATAEQLADPDYWVDHIRKPVRYLDGVRHLSAEGVTRYIEVGPTSVLASATTQILDRPDAAVTALLRAGEPEPAALLHGLAGQYARGLPVRWRAVYGAGPVAELPAYPFQRSRHWLDTPAAGGGTGHALLGAAVELADGSATVHTGRLSAGTHPWLAEHRVDGRAVLPAAALAELVLHAAGPGRAIDSLALRTPLPIPDAGAVPLQIAVGGTGSVTVHSRQDGEWVTHAEATVTETAETGTALTEWPPDGEPIDLEGRYDALEGLDYGPAFRGVRAAWRAGGTVYTEVALPEGTDVAGHGLHPALFDAALHGPLLTDGAAGLPFALAGVSLHARGASALRVRIDPADGGYSVLIADQAGNPVATVAALAVRAGTRAPARLHRVEWAPAEPRPGQALRHTTLTGIAALGETDALAEVDSTDHALALLQAWLANPRLRESTLALRTGPSPEHAPARGLVRAAQVEHPGRFALIDADGTATPDLLAAAAVVPESRVRDGVLLTPRLVRPQERTEPHVLAGADGADGTVLITGGTGALGSALARHLVVRHGARKLVLAGRAGGGAPRAEAIRDELTALGARVDVVACDVGDREDLARLLAGIADLRVVVHAAGTVRDGAVATLEPAAVAAALAAKADGARHLHELTSGLAEFILFSSLAGTLGNAGQGAYAAANAALDELALARSAAGLPALALAWGPWESGMAADLTDADRRRMAAAGVTPMSEEDALALFDAALGGGPVLLAAALNPAAALARRARPATAPVRGVRERIAALPDADRDAVLLDLVRGQAAAVLGHDGAAAVHPDRAFTDLGFDSLTALALRDALQTAAGLALPAAVVFDHATARALARHLRSELVPETGLETASLDDLDALALIELAMATGDVATEDDVMGHR
ncbi:SDR family NAD(P)-dependent oxidoreductase [Actinokineospora guangxiensis]|uniref:SDR family NAD(P)-dependent oxidoreductase n=1 Tax=Actinokineospora guangxiensis TaxID=1490288 RepID=A0ABW0EHU7_9PSEU